MLTRVLAADIRALLDPSKIDRVTLIGFSVAGNDEARFAGLYSARVSKLVYLDAAGDRKSGGGQTTRCTTRPGPWGFLPTSVRYPSWFARSRSGLSIGSSRRARA